MACRRCGAHLRRGDGEGVTIYDEKAEAHVIYKLCTKDHEEFVRKWSGDITMREFDSWRLRNNVRSLQKKRRRVS